MRKGRQSRDRVGIREALTEWIKDKAPWYLKLPGYALFAAGWVFHRIAYGASSLVFTWPGRIFAAALLVMAFLDGAWGVDAIEVPVLGSFGFLLLFGALGVWSYERRRRWEDQVCEIIYDVLPGQSRTRPEKVVFGRDLGVLHTGTWRRTWDFAAYVPGAVQRGQQADLVEHLRQRLPAAEGASWGVTFDLRRSYLVANLVRDLPDPDVEDEPLRRTPSATPSGAGESPAEREWAAMLIPIGESREGEIIWNCSNLHGCIMIVGAPGGGKSVAAQTVMAHCFVHSEFWSARAIDMKRVEFAGLRKYMPNPVESVALDLDEALKELASAYEEVQRRYRLIEKEDIQNIHDLNALRRVRGEAPLKHLMIVLDEVAELTEEEGTRGAKEEDEKRARCKKYINAIVRLGRAAGVHMILSTQRPDAEYIPGSTKSNIQARLAVGNLSRTGSEMAIESPLASELPGIKGRGIWFESGKLTECQIYYTSKQDIDRIIRGQEAG